MWNPKLTLLPIAALGLAAVQGTSQPAPLTQDPAPGDDAKALAATVEVLEARVSLLEAYIEKQAKAAQALTSKIDEAVAAGYTSGINFKSREILVSAWKGAAKAQMDTASGKDKGADTGRTRRGR